MSSPDNMKEANIGVLAYYKPSSGLVILREQVLETERFDLAFRTYVERWAFKHPRQMISEQWRMLQVKT
jgi:hypothetical protein